MCTSRNLDAVSSAFLSLASRNFNASTDAEAPLRGGEATANDIDARPPPNCSRLRETTNNNKTQQQQQQHQRKCKEVQSQHSN